MLVPRNTIGGLLKNSNVIRRSMRTIWLSWKLSRIICTGINTIPRPLSVERVLRPGSLPTLMSEVFRRRLLILVPMVVRRLLRSPLHSRVVFRPAPSWVLLVMPLSRPSQLFRPRLILNLPSRKPLKLGLRLPVWRIRTLCLTL
jgi:hypothetical protein